MMLHVTFVNLWMTNKSSLQTVLETWRQGKRANHTVLLLDHLLTTVQSEPTSSAVVSVTGPLE